MNIDLQWMILALIMVEKSRQSHGRTADYSLLPPRAEEKTPVSTVSPPPKAEPVVKQVPIVDDISANALANAIRYYMILCILVVY